MRKHPDDPTETGIATGALRSAEEGVPFATSRSLVPLSWSANSAYRGSVQFFGAGIASMISAVVTNPVDIIKVRQQLDREARGSAWATGRKMASTEGIRSLMKGTSASVAREGTYSMIRIGSYEMFKDQLSQHTQGLFDTEGLPLKVCASIIAGTLGSAIATPTDLIKVKMQAHHRDGSPYRSMRHAFAVTYGGLSVGASARDTMSGSGVKTPFLVGMKNIYRGIVPTVVRGWTVAACQMPAYDHTKQALKSSGLLREGLSAHLAASSFAGLVVSLASNPVDVVKVRLMDDSTGRYKGIADCVGSVLRKEGILAFYKGFLMCWARLGTHTIVTYMAYEQIRLLAGVKPL